MFRRRLAGYKELGYSIEMPPDAAPVLFERETAGASNTLDGICAIAPAPTFALQSPSP